MPRRTEKKSATTKNAPKKTTTTAVPHDEIAREAFKLYQSRHGAPGDPVADWFEATRIVTTRVTTTTKAPKTMTAEASANGGSRTRARSRRRSRK